MRISERQEKIIKKASKITGLNGDLILQYLLDCQLNRIKEFIEDFDEDIDCVYFLSIPDFKKQAYIFQLNLINVDLFN